MWTRAVEFWSADAMVDVGVALDADGYDALFLPAGEGTATLDLAGRILGAVEHLAVVTGIVNIWLSDPLEMVEMTRALVDRYPGRFLLGLGASHRTVVDRDGAAIYSRPYTHMVEYLDAMDRAPSPIDPSDRLLAALGPRMLALARDRSAGAHPFCTTVAHTKLAREILGPDRFLAPELKVVIEEDPVRARAVARRHLRRYLSAENYVENLRRFGFGDDDFADEGSDRLIDELVAWGDVDAIAERFGAHLDAGADHVCLEVIGGNRDTLPYDEWRTLAEALGDR